MAAKLDDNLESSFSNSELDDEDMNYFGYDDEQEFESIFTTISQKQKSHDQNFKLTLKYLFKLLKFYKLEHYVNELIDNGYLSPLALIKLSNKDFDMFSVSPYDKKKFLKLQLFLKQVMNTIKMTCKTSNKICLNVDPNLDFKMFTINEWKQLTNQSSSTLNSIAKQTSNSNDQLKDKNPINLNENKSLNTPIWTEINPKVDPECDTQKEMKQTNKNTGAWPSCQKSVTNRTKSIPDQNNLARKSTNQVSARSLATLTPELNSVTHPIQTSSSKSVSNFFGPKINSLGKEISNVELINDKGYNYGVPQIYNKNKGFIKKNTSVSTRLSENPAQQISSTLVTNEIFVFARKRPKLATEAEYQDSVLVENGENQGNICINEVKQAVDGSPILRKVVFVCFFVFDSQEIDFFLE